MDKRVEKWLWDILLAIKDIEEYLGAKRDFFEYQNNKKTRLAIERSLEIIGEAMNRILSKEPDLPVSHARNIVGLRNFIIHAYDKIDESYIWAIIVKDIPLLREEIEELLKEE